MGQKSLTVVNRSTSILDRVPTQNQPLTEAQALTDRLVSVSIQEGTDLKTAAAMLGAGWVSRFTRIGAMAALPGQAFARGASFVPALAAESAAFAGVERGFHPSSQPFHKDWARAAATLGPLNVFGGLTRGQNIVVQHLFTDLGLVTGHHGAAAMDLMEKPQGSFAEQMMGAEAATWQMKGSLAFAHGLSPRLSAGEKSLDIFLNSQENGRFNKGGGSPFFSQLAMAANREPGSFSVNTHEASEPVYKIEGKGGGGGKIPDRLTPEEYASGISEAVKALVEMAESGDATTREEALSALVSLVIAGVKDAGLADALHQMAMAETDAALLERRDSTKGVMALEWFAASACPVGLEPSRGVLYKSALMLALKAKDQKAADSVIREALSGDSQGVATKELERSAKDLKDSERRFVLTILKQAKEVEAERSSLPEDPLSVIRMKWSLEGRDRYNPFMAKSLASLGEEEGFSALRRLVQEPDFKRWLAAANESFGLLIMPRGKPKSPGRLLSWQRLYSAEALGKFGAKEDIDMFQAWLKDKDPRRRALAAAALAKHETQQKEEKTVPGIEGPLAWAPELDGFGPLPEKPVPGIELMTSPSGNERPSVVEGKTGEKTREFYLEELEELATKERWESKDLYELIRGGNDLAMKALFVMVAHEEHPGAQLEPNGLGLEGGPWWALNALRDVSIGGAKAISSLKRLTFTDHEPALNVLTELARTNGNARKILIELANAGSGNARRALASL